MLVPLIRQLFLPKPIGSCLIGFFVGRRLNVNLVHREARCVGLVVVLLKQTNLYLHEFGEGKINKHFQYFNF